MTCTYLSHDYHVYMAFHVKLHVYTCIAVGLSHALCIMCHVTCLSHDCSRRNPDIKTLPLNLGRLHNCWELTLHGLTLTNVPHHLMPGVRGGSAKRLLAYLRAQLRHCLPYNRMKLMAVGLQVCLDPTVN